MPTGEILKGLVDAIANCRLCRAKSGDSAQPLAHNTMPSGVIALEKDGNTMKIYEEYGD